MSLEHKYQQYLTYELGNVGMRKLILQAVEHLVVPVTRPSAGGAVERLGSDSLRSASGTLGGLSSFSPPVPCRFHALSCLRVEGGNPAVRIGNGGNGTVIGINLGTVL